MVLVFVGKLCQGFVVENKFNLTIQYFLVYYFGVSDSTLGFQISVWGFRFYFGVSVISLGFRNYVWGFEVTFNGK